MSNSSADRNLLFGILAMQMDFVTREALIAATSAWVRDKTKPLDQILVAQGALPEDAWALLAPLVDKHLEMHDHDGAKSLASVSSVGTSIRRELTRLGDMDVEASLAHVAAGRNDDDPLATQAPSVIGDSTSRGMRFLILRPFAKGGLGLVSVALDKELHREVALKEIQSQFADSADSRARFVQEAEITGGLEHPGIVPVYGLGQYADGRPFYAMRFIRGDSLKEAIDWFHMADQPGRDAKERSLELRKLLGRFIDVCNAIEYAHSRGVLHRDLKPGNVMLGNYGETLVVDWGLAKPVGKRETKSESGERTLRPAIGSGSATQMGSVIGTPAYMSPEQAAGRLDQLGPSSDVYSLGATLYCVLTGQAPLTDADQATVLRKVQKGDFPSPCEIHAQVPKPLGAICLKAMALKQETRYASPQQLADDVERFLADEPVTAHAEPVLPRARRWIRNHQTFAVSVATSALVAIVTLSVLAVIVATKNRDLELANKAERRAAGAAQRNLEVVHRTAYITDMLLAQRDWEYANVGHLRELLNRHRDGGDYLGFECGYWDRLVHSDLLTLEGHTHSVNSVVFSPDGQRLASASSDETVKVWDAYTGQELLTLQGHNVEVTSVAFSPDGQRLASASSDETIKVWDVTTGHELLTLKGHNAEVTSMAFSPDGQRLASASSDETIKVWDVTTGEELLTWQAHTNEVTGVVFSPDGKQLASASRDKTVKVWDAATGKEMFTLEGHSGEVTSVAYSLDGQKLVSASSDHTVKLWHVAAGQELFTLSGHTNEVTGVVFSPDGKQLASASRDKTVKVWDAATGKEMFTLKGHSGEVTSVAFSPQGQRLASASDDKTVKVWAAVMGQESLTLKGHFHWVSSVVFSPNGQWLASASSDKTVKVWDVSTGHELLTLTGHSGEVTSLAFSPDGQWLAASNDKTVKVWDATTGQELHNLKGHTDHVTCVAFSLDGKRLASASEDHTVKVWDAANGQETHTLRGHTDWVSSVAFSRDGRLASASDKTIKVWDVDAVRELLTLKGHANSVTCVAFSPDGKRLASASVDHTVKVWDATGKELLTLTGHSDWVSSVAFSPNGQRLASASSDKTVKVWDVDTGHELLTLKGHSDSVSSVAFSPDGQQLASASRDKTVKVWDGRPWTEKLKAKQQALVFAREAWQIVRQSDSDPNAYALALRRIRAAVQEEPSFSFLLNALGVAQYRVGDYTEALTTLTRSEQLNREASYAEPPTYVVFIVMTLQKLGYTEEAKERMVQLQKLIDRVRSVHSRPNWAIDEEMRRLMNEAATLLETDSRPGAGPSLVTPPKLPPSAVPRLLEKKDAA